MPYNFVWYPTPLDAVVTLTPDGGAALAGHAAVDPHGRACQICEVPDGTATGHGAQLDQIPAPPKLALRLRGILALHEDHTAGLQVDDATNPDPPVAPPQPGPTPPTTGGSPQEIIQRVYDTTHPNLSTIPGCGEFTENVCDALHEEHSTMWGHIDKNPGQNQYNGHAVDAVMLLANAGDTSAGVYDIIYSSASPEAKPSFNFAGPPDYNLWYYPTDALTRGATLVMIPRGVPRHHGR